MNDARAIDVTKQDSGTKGPGFLVFGVPRSGTTFFAKILNGHPDIVCGSERFHGHSFSPEHLTEEGFRTRDLDRKSAEQALALLDIKSGRPGLTLGEKFPRAFMHLDAILPRFDATGETLRTVVLVRDIQEIANSWYRRAVNPNDASWHRGMRGVFPYIEYLILAWQLSRIQACENVLLVSYSKYLDPAHRSDVMGAVAAHLGVADIQPMLDVMEAEAEKTAQSVTRDRSEDPVDFQSDLPFFKGFKDLVDAPGTCLLKQVQTDLRRMVNDLWDDGSFAAEVLDHMRAETNPDIRAYQNEISGFYRGTFLTLDRGFADQIKSAMDGSDGGMQARTPEEKTRRYFDITDTIHFVSVHGGVTGIQRVQLDAILALAQGGMDADDLGVFLDPDRGWVGVPLAAFAELCKDGRNLQASFRKFAAQVGKLEPVTFTDGDVIYFLGATWAVPSFLESLSPLRLQGVRTVFYLHDVLPLQVPEHFTAKHSDSFTHWLKSCLSCADGIICNSEETRNALLEYVDFSGPIAVANLNIMPSFIDAFKALPVERQSAPLESLGLSGRDYVLMVGTLEPRKNHATALSVWSSLVRRLGQACPTLVLVGKPGWMSAGITQAIETSRFPGTVIGLTNVDDQQLASLYRNALFSLSISRREGWGLPITESLALGTPCVTGTQSGAQDAMQGLTYLVDELSERDIADKIEDLLTDRSKLDALRDRIAKTARFKTWHDFATELRAFRTHLKAPQSLPVPALQLNCSYRFGTSQVPALKSLAPTGLQLRSGLGWNAPDSWGNWSRKAEADLAFQLPSGGGYFLYAVVTPTLSHDRLPLAVHIGENAPWRGTLFPERRSLVVLGFEHPQADRPVTVRFHSGAPYDFGKDEKSADSRTLGFALIELRVIAKADLAGRLEALENLVQKYLTH